MAITYDVYCSNDEGRGYELNITNQRLGDVFNFKINAWREFNALMRIDITFEEGNSVTLYLDEVCCRQLISCLQEAAARVFNI